MKPFTANVIKIIRQIPEGNVMTYGQVARVAGSPRAARQVVRILHTMSRKYQLPWHRVVNRNGQIVLKDDEGAMNQKCLLEDEGITVSETGQVNLTAYKFDAHLILDEEE